METTLPPFLTPDLPTLELRCRYFGRAAMLVLVLPVEAGWFLAAFWACPGGGVTEVAIGRA